MSVLRLEDDFLEHLRVEFGDAGRRAVDFLETVPELIHGEPRLRGRVGEMVAYCCREALTSIVKVGEAGERGLLSEFAEAVVSAAHRLDADPWTQEVASRDAFDDLLDRIGELEQFQREGVRTNEARLISAMIRRAGVEPLRSGTGPVVEFQQLFKELNDGLHSDCSIGQARELWSRCCALLKRLFQPPAGRHAELERLAVIGEPTTDDLDEVLSLAATTTHLQHFFGAVRSPRWLHLVLSTDLFEGGVSDLWWAAGAAAERLVGAGQTEAVEWLAEIENRYGSDVECARCIANVARRIGQPVVGILLRVVRRHQTDWPIVQDAAFAATGLDATDDMVRRLCDVLFNELCWGPFGMPDRVAEHFANGVTDENCRDRLELLVFKLSKVPSDDRLLQRLNTLNAGSLSDPQTLDRPRRDNRSSVLASCLVGMLRSAWDSMPVDDLLALLDDVPEELGCRVRTWLLACAPEVTSSHLASDLLESMSSRWPNGDDPRFVGRAAQSIEHDQLADICHRAFGQPPPTAEIDTALEASDVPSEWLRIASWIQLLPAELDGPWASPGAMLAARFSLRTPEALSRLEPMQARSPKSPYSAEQLASMPPVEAARVLAEWRSDERHSHIDAFAYGRTLESVVKQDPIGWLQSPAAVIEALQHPSFIVNYVSAAKELAGDHRLPAGEFIDLIWQRCIEPHESDPPGESPLGLADDWRDLRDAGIELIRRLVKGGDDLGDSATRAWYMVDTAARDLSVESGFSEDMDSCTRALNRPCTRAFETAIIMSAAAVGSDGQVRPEMIDLLSWAIRLEGNDGTEYRAVLARLLPWLRNTVSDWFTENLSVLLGSDAPSGLAQSTVDAALQWGQPDYWLFENYPKMTRDAVARGVEEAIDQYLIAAIWECDGYRISQVVEFLAEDSEISAKAASRLGYLISHDDVDSAHLTVAANLWKALLSSSAKESTAGFGGMSQVQKMDFERWASLTVDTLRVTGGRIDDAIGVADRAMSLPVTDAKMELLDEMIRGRLDAWDLRHIADNIPSFLEGAQHLRAAPQYQSLETALLERDMIQDPATP